MERVRSMDYGRVTARRFLILSRQKAGGGGCADRRHRLTMLRRHTPTTNRQPAAAGWPLANSQSCIYMYPLAKASGWILCKQEPTSPNSTESQPKVRDDPRPVVIPPHSSRQKKRSRLSHRPCTAANSSKRLRGVFTQPNV